MTMTADPTTDPQVASILDNLRQLTTQVKEIDAELGTDDLGPVALRNKVASELVTQFASTDDNVQKFVTQVVQAIKDHFSASPEVQAAVYTELHNKVGDAYGKDIKKLLDAKVAALPKPDASVVAVSDARKTELATKRSNATSIFRLQKEMLKIMGILTLPSDIEEPTVRRGAIGPRGAAFTKTYQYYVDGKLRQLTDTDTGEKVNVTLSNLANTVTKDLNWKTKDLRDYIIKTLNLTETEVDGKKVVEAGDSWEVTLPALSPDIPGKVLKGVAVTATADESDDGEEAGEDAATEATEPEVEDMFSGSASA